MTEPLRQFLLDAIAEYEHIALAADGPHWVSGDGGVSEGGLYAVDSAELPESGWAIAWFELGWTNQKDDGTIRLPAYPNWERHAHQNSVHAATWDPARVLLHCRMLRQVIAVTPPVEHWAEPGEDEFFWCPKARKTPQGDLPGGPDAECECGADDLLAHGGPLILQILVQPLADRPGFQPEWRRDG